MDTAALHWVLDLGVDQLRSCRAAWMAYVSNPMMGTGGGGEGTGTILGAHL